MCSSTSITVAICARCIPARCNAARNGGRMGERRKKKRKFVQHRRWIRDKHTDDSFLSQYDRPRRETVTYRYKEILSFLFAAHFSQFASCASARVRNCTGEYLTEVVISIKLLHARALVPKNLHTGNIRNAARERESEIKRFRLPLFRSNRVFVSSSSACTARNGEHGSLSWNIYRFFSRRIDEHLCHSRYGSGAA